MLRLVRTQSTARVGGGLYARIAGELAGALRTVKWALRTIMSSWPELEMTCVPAAWELGVSGCSSFSGRKSRRFGTEGQVCVFAHHLFFFSFLSRRRKY